MPSVEIPLSTRRGRGRDRKALRPLRNSSPSLDQGAGSTKRLQRGRLETSQGGPRSPRSGMNGVIGPYLYRSVMYEPQETGVFFEEGCFMYKLYDVATNGVFQTPCKWSTING